MLPVRPIDFLYRGYRHNPDGVAVQCETGETLSYRHLVRRVESLASALVWMCPAPRSRVAICAHNTLEHLLALLATMAAGMVWIPINPRLGRNDIEAIIAATRPQALIADESCLELVPATEAPVIVAKPANGRIGTQSIASLTTRFDGQAPAVPELPLDDLQAIKFTAGSTGRPKGVMQSYRCWNTHIVSILHGFGFGADDVNLVAAPLTHGSSCFVMPILAAGGRITLLERPSAPAILDAFENRGVTTVYLPPTLIYRLLAEAEAVERSWPRLKHLIWSAAPMPSERIRQTRATFGAVLETCYGQAEAPQIVAYMRAHEFANEANLGSVGRAGLLSRTAIMDRDGGLLPDGEVGEIVVRGDLLMNGYLDQPELTAETVVAGWLHTGDLGFIDERGYLFIKERLTDVVITGGFNVYPNEVESVLIQHPAVYDCAVFGVPDDYWGESVQAAVQLRDGARGDAETLIGFVKQRLGSVKAPKKIHFYADLPRSAVGKILRRELRAAAAREADTISLTAPAT